MTQKELRKIARQRLAAAIQGTETVSPDALQAIAVALNAPYIKGE